LSLVALAAATRHADQVPVMTGAAKALLASLTPEQREKISFGLDDAERTRWF
jgi:hypothetical protein